MANLKKTLRETHPTIADMWAYELNGELTPDDVSIYSDKKAYFQCKRNSNHIFQKPIRKMVSDRDGHIVDCIYCGPNAKIAFPGETDLLSIVDEAKTMWDYSRNTLDPKTILPKSNKYAYFKCEIGHSVYRKIEDFSHSPSCPECQKQNILLISTDEKIKDFWDYKKNKSLNLNSLIQSSTEMAWFKCPHCDYEWNASIKLWCKKPYCSCCGFDGKDYRKIEESVITIKMKVPEILDIWDYEKNGDQTPDSIKWRSNYDAYFKCQFGHTFHRPIYAMYRNQVYRGCIVCKAERKANKIAKSIDTVEANETTKKNNQPSELLNAKSVKTVFDTKQVSSAHTNTISFQAYNPEAAKLWVDELNNGITPDRIASKSGKTINMRCVQNPKHIYSIKICNIPSGKPYGCPYCRKHSIVSAGENDLFSISKIAKTMWNYEENKGYELDAISPKSADKVTWICNNGHCFSRRIRDFVANSECPICKKSQNAIVCFPHMVKQWDFKKNKGIDINTMSSNSKKTANWKCKKCGYEWKAQISSRKSSKGLCPCCETRIVVHKGVTDLFTQVPELKEWYDTEKNKGVDITMLSISSKENIWWKCPSCDYSWSISPSARVVHSNGGYTIRNCPVCSGVKRGLNYSEEFPDLSESFVDELNGCSLDDIGGSERKAVFWWHCDICDENFESTLASMIRARNTASKGCSYCAGKKVSRENSFASLHPEVMDEYDPSNEIDPYTVTEYSNKCVKWICRNNKDHKWEARFQWRSRGQGNCNICRGYQYGKMFYEDHAEYEQYYDTSKNQRPFHSLSNMSNDYVWWKCSNGHSFERTVYNTARMGSFRCPVCENLIVQIGENDLASQYPDLAKEYNVEKNGALPQDVSIASSSNETWWKCSEGHEFQRSVYNRIHRFSECPVCNRTVVVKGVNDLLHTYPMITGVWDYELNERNPDDISDKNTGSYHFTCQKGHRYYSLLNTIKSNRFECLVCNNKIIQVGVNSLVDTDYELSQEFSPNEDRKPTEFTKQSAYWALWRCNVCGNDYHWSIKDRTLGDDSCPFCNNRYTKLGINSLLDTNPELAKEYAPDNEYDVTRVNKESRTWAYWICPKCHGRYSAYVNEREVGDDSCPYCKNERALEGLNSLLDTHSLLAEEWSPNNDRDVSEFLKSNTYTALWNCPTCHGEYSARICDREVGDDNCPYCRNKKALPGYNSFKVKHMDLMEEWDFINNYLLCNPDEILDSSLSEVWWNCKTCNTRYLMSPKKKLYYQHRHMKSCPYCKGLRRKKKYFY